MAEFLLLQCITAFDVAINTYLAFDMAGGAAERYIQQHLFIGGGCDSSHCANFGETDPALPKRFTDLGQAGQGAGNPDLFTGRANIDSTPPVQPMGTRLQGCRR